MEPMEHAFSGNADVGTYVVHFPISKALLEISIPIKQAVLLRDVLVEGHPENVLFVVAPQIRFVSFGEKDSIR